MFRWAIQCAALVLCAAAYSEEYRKVNVGIDLGTTYSCVCFCDIKDKTYSFLRFREGSEIIPSTAHVSKRGEHGLVMEVGYDANILNEEKPRPDAFFYGFKRLMGVTDFALRKNEELKNFPKNVSYKVEHRIKDGKGGYAFPVMLEDGVKIGELTPFELSLRLLLYFKSELDRLKCIVNKTYITTPAYFDRNQDELTKEAARAAGFKDPEIAKEPVAACVNYTSEGEMTLDAEENALVFDFGGGTLDISVVEVEKVLADEETNKKITSQNAADMHSHISVLKCVGDNFLGGENFNDELVAHFRGKMPQEISQKLSGVDVLRLRIFAENFKINLCNSLAKNGDSASHTDQFLLENGRTFDFTLNGTQFDQLMMPVYNRINTLLTGKDVGLFRKLQGASVDVPLDPMTIQKIILVGGSTRVPYISKLISKACPKAKLYKKMDVDKAVAKGACQIAVNSDTESGVSNLTLIGAVPLSVGIRVHDGSFVPLLKKSNRLPCESSQTFTTYKDNQTAIDIEIAMGERVSFDDNIKIGKLKMELTDKLPKGEPKIEITLGMTDTYQIKLNAKELNTGKELKHEFDSTVGKVSQEDIDAMVKSAAENATADAELKKKLEALSMFNLTLETFKKELASAKLPESQKLDFEAVLSGNTDWYNANHADEAITASVVEDKLKALQEDLEKLSKALAEAKTAEPKEAAVPKEEKMPEEAAKETGREEL